MGSAARLRLCDTDAVAATQLCGLGAFLSLAVLGCYFLAGLVGSAQPLRGVAMRLRWGCPCRVRAMPGPW